MAAVLSRLLEADWSPQQIARLLPVLLLEAGAIRLSHVTIY